MKETEYFQVFINNFESANSFYKIAKDFRKIEIEKTFERKKVTSLALGRFRPNSLPLSSLAKPTLAQPDSRESSPTFVPEAPAWRHLVAASPL
jgi:hypothetical protein